MTSHGSKGSLALYYTSYSSKPINFVSDIVLLSQNRSPTLISFVSLAYASDYRLGTQYHWQYIFVVYLKVVDLAYELEENWELQKVTATYELWLRPMNYDKFSVRVCHPK